MVLESEHGVEVIGDCGPDGRTVETVERLGVIAYSCRRTFYEEKCE